MTTKYRAPLVGATALFAGAAIALAVPMSASAHVSASSDSTAAGSYAIATFSVPHGCDGSPTQVVTIDIPESIASVTPTIVSGWDVEKVAVPLEVETEDSHGEIVTERTGQVVYTSTTGGLAEGFREAFELSLQLPDGDAGDVVEFPVTQDCTEGSVVWEGADVPAITLTAATEGDDHGHDAAAEGTEEHTDDATETAAATTTSGGSDVIARVLGIGGLVVGVVGLIVGVTARRRSA